MDWTHGLSALYGACFALLFAWGAYRVALEKRKPGPVENEDKEDPMEKDERDQIDRAFHALDEQEKDVGGDLANNVFPLAPRGTPAPVVTPTKPKAEDKIIVEAKGHPCRFLDATTPPHFQAGECQGICRHPGQSGRICFWVANVATQCSYFDPKVRPRVKLRTMA